MGRDDEHPFPFGVNDFLGTLAQLCAARGDASGVAMLAVAKPSIDLWSSDPGYNGGSWGYHFALRLPVDVFVTVEARREKVEESIRSTANDVLRMGREHIERVTIVPDVAPIDNWRAQAVAWLRGEGINNQGRVRSDNIATRQQDGLLFRSGAEINLYRALKDAGVSFAPLPVFIRGGADYRRIEPDFVIVEAGMVMAVEVDGDTVHRETPAEAHDRAAMLMHQGVHVERVKASECDSVARAKQCAERLLGVLRQVKAARA